MTYLQIVTEATVDLQVSDFPGWPLMVCWSVSVEGHPLSPAVSLYCFRTPFAEQERQLQHSFAWPQDNFSTVSAL